MSKQKKTLGDMAAVGSALAGAALGAAAVLLTDKKNQKKLEKTIDEVSKESVKIGKNLKKKAEELAGFSKREAKITKKKTIPVKRVVKKKTTTKKVYAPLKKD
jgi:hypothetical protein